MKLYYESQRIIKKILSICLLLFLAKPGFTTCQSIGEKAAAELGQATQEQDSTPSQARPLTRQGSRLEKDATPQQQIKAELKRIAIEHKMPCMFAGYQTLGKPMVAAVGGYRKNKSRIKVTLDDQVHLGSCTKAMTATMIARLIERGELKNGTLTWDMTIEEGLPELVKDLAPVFAKVTLQQLLMHRGGCPANTNWSLGTRKKTITETRRSLVRMGLRKKQEHSPGEYHYSNLGYVVASLMASKATGKSWEDLMREEIFEPLELKSAGFGPPGTPGEVDQPWGHVTMGTLQIPVQGDNPAAIGPAGTVHMSISDWAKFCLSHSLTEKSQTTAAKKLRLVSQETLDFLHTPLAGAEGRGDDYALGWRVFNRDWGGTVLVHAGSNTMWLATVKVSLENESVYLAATNVSNEEVGEALEQIFETLIRLEKEARVKSQPDKNASTDNQEER